MIEKYILLSIAVLAFNVPIFVFIKKIYADVDFTHLVSEKALALPATPTAPGDDANAPVSPAAASTSRIVALMVSIVLACLLWGCGNYALFAAFFEPERIMAFMNGIQNLFVYGMTLYAPYGANKLTGAFKS